MNGMISLLAVLACLVIGGLLGYLIAMSRRSALAEETAQLRSSATLWCHPGRRARGAKKSCAAGDARDRMTHAVPLTGELTF